MSNIVYTIFTDILDEVLLGKCFEVHRASKTGTLFIDETSPEEDRKYAITDEKGLDVFGQSITQIKKHLICACPNCKRSLAASRFAPHLEKCLGMGRVSSRLASKRITGNLVKTDEFEKNNLFHYSASHCSNKSGKNPKKPKVSNGSIQHSKK